MCSAFAIFDFRASSWAAQAIEPVLDFGDEEIRLLGEHYGVEREAHPYQVEVGHDVSMLFRLEGNSRGTRFEGVVTAISTDDDGQQMVTAKWSDGASTTFDPLSVTGFQIETRVKVPARVDCTSLQRQWRVFRAFLLEQNVNGATRVKRAMHSRSLVLQEALRTERVRRQCGDIIILMCQEQTIPNDSCEAERVYSAHNLVKTKAMQLRLGT